MQQLNHILDNACTLIPDYMIEKLKIVTPCLKKTRLLETGKKVISYGLSPYGYDVRLSDEAYIYNNDSYSVVDVKNFDNRHLSKIEIATDIDGNGISHDYILIPPRSTVLGRTIEWISVPANVLGICVGKSTYARAGILLNTTPLEPEWEGYITLEITNLLDKFNKIYVGEGIAQLLFFVNGTSYLCSITYKQTSGKYDKQQKVTFPVV